MKYQPTASCGGAIFAALFVLLLLAAEVAAFGLLAYRYISWTWLERGRDAILGLATVHPYINIALLIAAAWIAWRILSSTFNCFASLAEPEDGIGLLGYVAALLGLALLGGAAAAVLFPERWLPLVQERADAWPDLKLGVPYLPAYLLFVTAASLHSFRLMGDDRQRLRSNGTQLSESGMHWWEMLGGWPGSLIGMMIFRHKAASLIYLIVFVAAVAAHFAAVGGLLHLLKTPSLLGQ